MDGVSTLWFVVTLFLEFSSTQIAASSTEHKALYFQSERIANNINQTIGFSSFNADSFMRCASKCSELTSAVSLYFDEGSKTCHCNNQHDSSRVSDSSGSVIYAYITRQFEAATDVAGETTYYITSGACDSCDELYANGYKLTGLYVVQASDSSSTKTIYCDLAGEWTVFQKRFDGSVNFYRNWADYATGFGSPPNGEFWLGLDTIHELTAVGSCELLINLEAECGHHVQSSGYARYSSFSIGSADDNYALHVSGYSGNVDDALSVASGFEFSTYDADNDLSTGSCASQYKGGWWYDACHTVNLNGLYLNGSCSVICAEGLVWQLTWGFQYSLLKSEMNLKCVSHVNTEIAVLHF